MEFKDIKAWIETNQNENEELITYLGELGKVTTDKVEKWINEDEGKKFISKVNDRFFTKSLETWKQNNLEKEIDAEIKKRFPQKTESEIELEKVKSELERIKTDSQIKEVANKALKIATEKKLPVELIDFVVSTDEKVTINNLETLEKIFNSHIETAINEKLKSGYKPPAGSKGSTLTLEQIQNMSPEEINANWSTIQEIMQRK